MNYDLFISHSSLDKDKYVLPLCRNLETFNINYWLDSINITWGDNLVNKINEGISLSKYLLVCFSENFLKSEWTNAEFTSVYSVQNNLGQKKVLPLILDSKTQVLEKYPLMNSINYKEISKGIDNISQELIQIIKPNSNKILKNNFQIKVESKYSGSQFDFIVPKNSSLKYLADRVINTLGLPTEIDVKASSNFIIKWVLVDSKADKAWNKLLRYQQSEIVSFIKVGTDIIKTKNPLTKLQNAGVYDNIMFYLYPIENYGGGAMHRRGGIAFSPGMDWK